MERKFATPIIIALLGFNSYLLIKQNTSIESINLQPEMNMAIQEESQINLAEFPQIEGGGKAVSEALSANLQALSVNMNELRLAQERIEKAIVSLDNGTGILTAQLKDPRELENQVVENSTENIQAYSNAMEAVSNLSGATEAGSAPGILAESMPMLTDQQRAEIRNLIIDGTTSGAIDPVVASNL